MSEREFLYWIQGWFELQAARSGGSKLDTLDAGQLQCIRNHLNLVFHHAIDPTYGTPAHQKDLQDVHDGKKPVRNFQEIMDELLSKDREGESLLEKLKHLLQFMKDLEEVKKTADKAQSTATAARSRSFDDMRIKC